jgi:predicted lipoprotein with Yx(FWY)xxD motif
MNKHLDSKYRLKPISVIAILAIGAMVLSACVPAASAASNNTTPASQPTVSSAPIAQPTPTGSPSTGGASLILYVSTSTTLGQILVDNRGYTLYMFMNDTANTSACDAACQTIWQPLESASLPKAGPGVDASLIGMGTLPTGGQVITYNQHPLYYKATDLKPGDITGEDYKNLWYAVSPSGDPIVSVSSASPASPPISTPGPAAPIVINNPLVELSNNQVDGSNVLTIGGLTLYAYVEDTSNTSSCNAACQAIWMSIYITGTPVAGQGVDSSMLGTTMLSNGKIILTYNQMPLYFFSGDKIAGTAKGQGFDNAWFAVSPQGNMVGDETEVTISVATNPTLGDYLVDGNGQALYIYTKDTPYTSNCDAACMSIWPPVLSLGKPNLGSGVDSSMIGTITLPDNRLMVTYNGKPLYYYSGDGNPSQILGQGFKGIWYVMGSNGQPITTLLNTPN